jgi:tRNA A37 methylthiotransferase MiaB
MDKFLRSHIGQERQIIVENNNIGRTEHFAEAVLDKDLAPGSLARIRVESARGSRLQGTVLS